MKLCRKCKFQSGMLRYMECVLHVHIIRFLSPSTINMSVKYCQKRNKQNNEKENLNMNMY